MPSCAARIAATYPPGPEPMTTQSYWESAIGRLNLTNALWSLDPAHHADELPEQPADRTEDRDAEDHGGDVGGDEQRQRRDAQRDRQQRLEAEHGPVAPLPHPPRGEQHERREEHDAEGPGLLSVDVEAGHPRDDVGDREDRGQCSRDHERPRALLGRERLELG